ncbi:MAG: ribonuclease III [Clostridia bacterium]|nr:ribonuclease III [Clostridia bacterium]
MTDNMTLADTSGGAVLAYLGDSVLETLTRETLLRTGIHDVGRLNSMALSYVRATSQSRALENILPCLTDEEIAVFRRGRNAHSASVPRSASAGEYRRATGMEALFGWLYLRGEDGRMRELFDIAYPDAGKSNEF